MEYIGEKTRDSKDVLNRVMDRMLLTRPRGAVKFLPYTHCEAVSYQNRGHIEVDFTKVLSGYPIGACAHIKTNIISEDDQEKGIVLSLSGCARAVLNGEEIGVNLTGAFTVYPISLKKGNNELIIKTRALEDGTFGFDFGICVYRYAGMWASDYLFSTRATLPLEEYAGQDGLMFSEYYIEDAQELEQALKQPPEAVNYIFPKEEKKQDGFDFERLEARGNCAYAVTYVKDSIKLTHTAPIRVYLDKKPVYCGEAGECRLEGLKETEVIVKALKGEKGWGFQAEGVGKLPFPCDFQWLWIDGFEAQTIYDCFAPEYEIDLKRPYALYGGEKSYWKFNRKNTYLRPVLDTFFFGQWFYALMVGIHGLRIAAQELGNQENINYFNDHMRILCDYYDYAQYDYAMFHNATLLPRSCVLDNLDAIGTIGMNLCDYYVQTNYEKAKGLIEILADAVMHQIPRFPEDGVFHRGATMWADDIYMSCPFLARAGSLLNRPEYFDEAVRQIKGYQKRMWIEEKKLFSHIFFPEEGEMSRVPWGRGNGWILLSLTELFRYVPEEHPGMAELRALFVQFCEGIRGVAGENGIWHQVLDREDAGSYPETSCTAMFVVCFLRGYKLGLLDESYAALAQKAWNALLNTAVDSEGNICGVCMGSGCSKNPEYYFDIPTAVNDDHGTGIILMAGTEIYKLEANKRRGK